MTSQFFKDVHSNLNNKFISRTISLKMDQAADDKEDTSIDSTTSEPESQVSVNVANSSNVTSTGSSSRFFVPNNGVGGKGTEILTEYMLDDSSLDDINISRPKQKSNNQQHTDDDDDDDDIKITDVRTVAPGEHRQEEEKYNAAETAETSIDQYDNGNSSTDVMLEALYKSQKHNSYLKNSLEILNAKIANQEVEISKKDKTYEKMKEVFKQFKEKLTNLEQFSSELKSSRYSDNQSITALKAEHKGVIEILNTYKTEINNLKKQIDQLKKIKVSTSYEIEKRNENITLLQRRLDEKSGLLSEQKIKTVELEKSLENCRKQYDENIKSITDSSNKSQELLITKLDEACKQLEASTESNFKNSIFPLLTETGTKMEKKVDDLGKMFTKLLDLSTTSLTDQLSQASERTFESMTKLLVGKDAKDEKSSNEIMKSQMSHNEGLVKIVDLVEKINLSISNRQSFTENLQESVKLVGVRIQDLDKAIKDQQSHFLKIEDLTKEKEALEMDFVTHKVKIQELEDTISENESAMKEDKLNIESFKSEVQRYTTEITQLQKTIESNETTLKNLEDNAAKCKTNYESKLKTQMDIYDIVSKERDDWKKEAQTQKEELDSVIKVQISQIDLLEKENSRLTKDLERNTKAREDTHKKLMDSKKETADLRQEIKELKVKQTLKSQQNVKEPSDLGNDDSLVDIPLVFRSATITKPKLSTIPIKKTKTQLSKRKKLLDDDNGLSDFDFDFDAFETSIPSLPRRYTKKKKS